MRNIVKRKTRKLKVELPLLEDVLKEGMSDGPGESNEESVEV